VFVVVLIARVLLKLFETVGEWTVAVARFTVACIAYGATRRKRVAPVRAPRAVWVPTGATRCRWCGAVDWEGAENSPPPTAEEL
jgi:hypothetical protein